MTRYITVIPDGRFGLDNEADDVTLEELSKIPEYSMKFLLPAHDAG